MLMAPLPPIDVSAALAFGMPGGWEWLIIGAIGLLIFGRRLPEVGRSLGRGIVEFKKGIKGIEDEIDEASSEGSKKPQVEGASSKQALSEGGSEEWADERRRVSTKEAVAED
jgi:sec-independent protein translocase protein TatA